MTVSRLAGSGFATGTDHADLQTGKRDRAVQFPVPIDIERFEREPEFGGGETNAERVLESLDSRLGPEDMDEWRAAADEASDS